MAGGAPVQQLPIVLFWVGFSALMPWKSQDRMGGGSILGCVQGKRSRAIGQGNWLEQSVTGNRAKPMDNNNLLRQLMMIGVGTTSLVADKIREVSEEWVSTGRLDPTQAAAFVDDFLKQFKADQGNVEEQFQRQLGLWLQDLGVPRQNEMDELRGRLDRLERKLRELENRRW